MLGAWKQGSIVTSSVLFTHKKFSRNVLDMLGQYLYNYRQLNWEHLSGTCFWKMLQILFDAKYNTLICIIICIIIKMISTGISEIEMVLPTGLTQPNLIIYNSIIVQIYNCSVTDIEFSRRFGPIYCTYNIYWFRR